MTPEQRQYDLDLAASMRTMANWVTPLSRKVSDTLKLGADRITALTAEQPIEPEGQANQVNIVGSKQPASTPTKIAPDKKRR